LVLGVLVSSAEAQVTKRFSLERLAIILFLTLAVVVEGAWIGMLFWGLERLLF
jgi:hypothetical protein